LLTSGNRDQSFRVRLAKEKPADESARDAVVVPMICAEERRRRCAITRGARFSGADAIAHPAVLSV
jgi:hypothetical protein